MLLELIVYEVGTTAASLLGFKAISMANLKQRMQGINRPKQLPIIDKYLKSQVGRVSKRENWLARKAVTTVQRLSQYQAFEYVLILAGRKARESQMAKSTGLRGISAARGKHNPWATLHE